MQCKHCNTHNDKDAAFCGHCGKQLAPADIRDAAVAYATRQARVDKQWPNAEKSQIAASEVPFHVAQPVPSSQLKTPAPSAREPQRTQSTFPLKIHGLQTKTFKKSNTRNIAFLTIMLSLLFIGILAGAITLMQNAYGTQQRATSSNSTSDATGTISFSDSQNGEGDTDSLKISASGLSTPPAGSHYAAWLLNEQTEHILPLGTLSVQTHQQAGQTFAMSFMDQGTNLLGAGNKVEITQETINTTLPTGKVLLVAQFPPLAFIHVKHLLVAFPTTPGNIGLLVGLSEQSQQLLAQAQTLHNVTQQTKIQCIAQNMINLIEGKNGEQAQPLAKVCTTQQVMAVGDGFGLLGANDDGYTTTVATHASLAATQPDATAVIRTYAQQIILATNTINVWLATVDQEVRRLLANPANTANIPDILTLSNEVLNGSHDQGAAGVSQSICRWAINGNAYSDTLERASPRCRCSASCPLRSPDLLPPVINLSQKKAPILRRDHHPGQASSYSPGPECDPDPLRRDSSSHVPLRAPFCRSCELP